MSEPTDRELLELAAKAAGVEVHEWRKDYQGNWFGWLGQAKVYVVAWSPLTDDGDALRLAVRLRLTIGEHLGARYAGIPPCADDFEDGGYPARIAQLDLSDPCAATRRAIVRAAAEIGRSLP